ncbi:MAG TPA: maleylpyruvate isomerase N-terminal domain-containing protein [Acidimicrobiales bacterium]
MNGVIEAFRDAGGAFSALVERDSARRAWQAPSAVDGYTVGGLVAHTLIATRRLADVLDLDEPDAGLAVDLPAFYGANRVDTRADLGDGSLHAILRANGEELAQSGHANVVGQVRTVVAEVAERLPHERPERRVSVVRVRGGTTDLATYLRSRVVELVVHGDDVAASIGLAAFDASPLAWRVTNEALVELAVARSGAAPVMRSFARVERAPGDGLRVL